SIGDSQRFALDAQRFQLFAGSLGRLAPRLRCPWRRSRYAVQLWSRSFGERLQRSAGCNPLSADAERVEAHALPVRTRDAFHDPPKDSREMGPADICSLFDADEVFCKQIDHSGLPKVLVTANQFLHHKQTSTRNWINRAFVNVKTALLTLRNAAWAGPARLKVLAVGYQVKR